MSRQLIKFPNRQGCTNVKSITRYNKMAIFNNNLFSCFSLPNEDSRCQAVLFEAHFSCNDYLHITKVLYFICPHCFSFHHLYSAPIFLPRSSRSQECSAHQCRNRFHPSRTLRKDLDRECISFRTLW